MNELNKYNVVNDLVLGKINKNRASLILNLTRRQIDRLIIKFKNEGKTGFVHGNRNKNVKCLVIKTLTGSLYCNINNNIYVLEEVK